MNEIKFNWSIIFYYCFIICLCIFPICYIYQTDKIDNIENKYEDLVKLYNKQLLNEANRLKVVNNPNVSYIDLYDALILSIIEVESNFNKNAISAGPCIGLMQVKGGSFDASTNIRQGMSILHKNFNRACSEGLPSEAIIHKMLTSYNRGYHGSNKYYKKHGTYMSAYSKKVLRLIDKHKKKELE